MALPGLAGSGLSSRGPLDEAEAAAEEHEAPAVVAAGALPQDDEEDEGRGRGLLRWDGFSAWLHCVCVVGFDLELGQAVEVSPAAPCPRAPPQAPRRGVPKPSAWPAGRPARTPAAAHRGVACRPSAGQGRAAVHWQFPWEDCGLRRGVKSSL